MVLAKTLGLSLEHTSGHDTMLMAHLLDENAPVGLKPVAKRYLDVQEVSPTVTNRDMDAELQARLFYETQVDAVATNGRKYKKKAHRLVDNWEYEITEYYLTFSDGAVPYAFVMQMVGRAYTLMKKHGIVEFDGAWRGDFRHTPIEMACLYACDDTLNTLGVYHTFDLIDLDLEPGLRNLYETVERPVNDVMTAATYRGIALDRQHLEDMRETLERRGEEIHGEAMKLAKQLLVESGRTQDFDLDTLLTSASQIQKLLYEVVEFPVVERTATGNPSAGKTALKKLLDMKAKAVVLEPIAKAFIRKKLE